MQAQVAEAGINLTINKMESAPLREYIDGGNHHMCINAFTAQTMEADGFLAQVQPGTATLNRVGYERQEFFDTYEKGCGTLDADERLRNISGAFRVRHRIPAGHILVVDDTFTTGATLSECWITLRRALGPSVRISVATLAMVEA